MTAAAAVPVVTTAEMLTHVKAAASAGTLTAAQVSTAMPQATATSTPSGRRTTTSTPAAKATKKSSTAATPRATATTTPKKVTTHTYQGPVVYDREGAVQAVITVQGNRITGVSISAPQDDPRSAMINAQAVPILQQETLQAQSANVNVVSGATDTSEAYIQSLQAALNQAHL
jgi:uncharacterized protein with FMN-binding domain